MGAHDTSIMRKATQRLTLATHVLEQVYPTVNNPKLLLSVLQHTFLGMNYAMNAILSREKHHGRLKSNHQYFVGRLSAFEKCRERLGFEPESVSVLAETRELLKRHAESPVEFQRGEKFVICDDKYEMKILSEEKLTLYVKHAQDMVARAHAIIFKDQQNSPVFA